jgi:Ca2+-binding RTX toxin-like protein
MAIVHGTNSADWIDIADGVTGVGDTIYGYNGNDTIYGYHGNDTIYGGIDDDTIYGGAGLDTLRGDAGNDTLHGNGDADILNGGANIDTASYETSWAGVQVSIRANTAHGGDAEGDTLYSIENLTGSAYDDLLKGDDNSNTLRGGGGADNLKGYGAADTIEGGANNDLLNGGMGRDWLYGGADADTFVWAEYTETGNTAATADVVMDFNRAQGDLINLFSIDANVVAGGNQAFAFIGTAAFTLNMATPDPTDVVPGQVRYYHSGGNTYIEMQVGTSADPEGVIRLNGIHTPTAGWFVL